MKFDLTKLRAIQKELSVLSKVRDVDKLVGFPSKRIRRNVTKKTKRKTKKKNGMRKGSPEAKRRMAKVRSFKN